jgi:hypothetical protein
MGLEDKFKDREDLPSLRTVQRVVEDIHVKDTTAIWTIGSIKADVENISFDDARLLLDILKVVLFLTGGRKRSFTVKEAQWVLRIAKLLPKAWPETIWLYAQNYIWNEAQGIGTENLDLTMALSPDTSGSNAAAYDIAEGNRWIEPISLRYDLPGQIGYIEDVVWELYTHDLGALKPEEIAEFLGESDNLEEIKAIIKGKEREVKRERSYSQEG